METRKLIMIAIAISITFVQEQMLLFLPNIQFTVLLIIVFTSVFSFKESIIFIIGYVILDNMYMGGFNLFYMIPMLFAWSLIPIAYHTILRKTNNEYYLALFAFIFGFIYGWSFIPFNMIQTGINNFYVYLSADIIFEVIMAATGFVTVVWMFKPLNKVLKTVLNTQTIIMKKAYK